MLSTIELELESAYQCLTLVLFSVSMFKVEHSIVMPIIQTLLVLTPP